MANYLLCAGIFRVALPILISLCVIFRPSGLSAIYLLFLFVLPLIPIPTQTTINGSTGIYLKILIALSILTTLGQVAFQIVLFSLPPYGYFLHDCDILEKILRHVGFVRLKQMNIIALIQWVSPEPIILVSSVAALFLCKKLSIGRVSETEAEDGSVNLSIKKSKSTTKYFNVLVSIGRYLVLIALCFAAVLRPSIQGGLYFLIFLGAATWWACYKQLQKGFAILMRCVMAVVFLHICCLYAYQFQWPQELLSRNSTYARYFALTPILSVDCQNDPRTFEWSIEEWTVYINPIALFLLYYILALESKALLEPQAPTKQTKQIAGESTPLIRGVSPSKRYGSGKKGGTFTQDSTGSVTVSGENADDIPMEQLEQEYKPTLIENIMYTLEEFLQVIIKSSYIGTNIIMMTWSITYLSWLTFILLLWANLLWLVPNQRKSMLRSSPFLVFYAWFLLISAYIYSMDLTEEELPSTIQGVNLSQIGFQKVTKLACNPLLIKCLYTVMFWITLRQFMQERLAVRQSSALADMVAPLQVTVGTATGVDEKHDQGGSKIMEKIGKFLKKFATKFWIWVVAITLFGVAITGQRMTGFRILYMALFLVFILSFQLSFNIWRKMMFGFWLTVIVYSMINLVMVYTYQFDNFPEYWKDYLHVPYKQQLDIGLERFETKQLFVRLVTPTFFVVITVIQLHYFHKDFMALSDRKNANVMTVDLDESSLQGGGVPVNNSEKDEPTTTSSSVKFDLTDIGNISTLQIQKKWAKHIYNAINLIFSFLELHMPKIILFFAMLLCVYDKCAIYIILMIFIILGLTCGRPVQIFAIYASSVFVSIFLLARMIYQIQYIMPGNWNVTCEYGNSSEIENNAQWLGFYKSEDFGSVPYLVRWNIIFIIIVTLWSVILLRQFYYKMSKNKPTTRAFFMFPKITRSEADKNLKNGIKYLFNYGFYKFGVELSLMATVALIGFRMDLYALIYSIWLCVLFSLKRSTQAKLWNIYMAFIAILIPIQYFMTVGLPPTLCILFPWDKYYWYLSEWDKFDIYRRLQEWAYLLDTDYAPSPKKLLCDFFLLLFVSRQAVVFRIEKRNIGHEYAGGSNDSIIHHAEEKNFVNPVPDFITYCRSYLDVFKRAVLLSFLWITLAIVFLAGTNRVTIFSIGYLIGAFVFLWQGTDLYLKPIPSILKSWNLFLGYNVAVILIKTALQIVGCIFIQDLPKYVCWVIQLFGIGCIKKFGNVAKLAGLEDSDECKVPREFVGLVWDGMCFGFLILQRRIFESYNFFHMINETKATTILASRGAELIEELRLKRVNDQDEQEKRVLEKIKMKMDRIKANQQKIQGTSYKDSTNHFVDTIFKGRPKRQRKTPKTYKEAVRSGDYYMFDDLDDDEIDFIEDTKATDEEDEDAKRKGLTVGQISEHVPRSVTYADEQKESTPKPGTSKQDEEISEISEPKTSCCQKIINYVLFVWAFIKSVMISITNFLNKYSKDYRYVIKVLVKEKKILKETTDYSVGLRLGSGKIWQPAMSYHDLLRQSRENSSQMNALEEYEATEMSSYDQPTIIRLILAVWYIIMSRSEVVCYFIIFLNQIKSATFLSLPLPLMVFLWGTLTVPRPAKTFWVTIIAYTEVIVLIKCMFQFDIIPWNQTGQGVINSNSPFYPPRIIGIERNKDYAVWDLLLLLVVFFHRFMLKSMGLWRTSAVPAAILIDGDYRVGPGGTLVPVGGSSPNKRRNVKKKDSTEDLQKLVEEADEHEEERRFSILSEEELTDKIVNIKTEETDPSGHIAQSLRMTTTKYTETFKIFFQQLLDPTSRIATDVYSYMFLCDFFNFFVILIGYSSFGSQQGDGGVQSYLEDNRVPVLFLVMLILQFMLIIIDRGIYLRKNILAKIIFQFIQVFILHLWLFILFPIITERSCNSVLPPQMYYLVKCFYLLLSAYQLRCGYPTRILGNFLCKGYTYLNMFLFRGFMTIPFLYELRTIMDWMWTDTSMTVFDWIKMEDIFAHIFLLKCTRHVEDEYPQARGERKSPLTKYFMGSGILLIIIAVIWFPLVFFSLGNAVGEANPPYDVTLEIRIGPYEPVYQISAQSNSIYTFTDHDMEDLMKAYSTDKIVDKVALSFISNYEASDITAVKLSSDSAKIWSISPPDRNRMVNEVNSSSPLMVQLEYKVSHKTSKPEDSGVIPDNVVQSIPASTINTTNVVRKNLLEMLKGNVSAEPVLFQNILPKFLKITNRGTAKPITQLMKPLNEYDIFSSSLRNITLNLLRTDNNRNYQEWWEIHEKCDDENYLSFLKNLPYSNCDSIILYTFNDKIFPATLNIITTGGILGLYTTLVFVASRVLRGFFAEQCFKIMFEDLPYVDRVLQLCHDIYLVRESREFTLEEDLFAKLVFLFRSPETLIKWTRPKEELDDEEDPEGA